MSEVCKDCLKWGKFGKDCWVYWERKKQCTMKVKSMDEWKELDSLIH